MTSGQYSFCLLLNADWLIQISVGLAVCKEVLRVRAKGQTFREKIFPREYNVSSLAGNLIGARFRQTAAVTK